MYGFERTPEASRGRFNVINLQCNAKTFEWSTSLFIYSSRLDFSKNRNPGNSERECSSGASYILYKSNLLFSWKICLAHDTPFECLCRLWVVSESAIVRRLVCRSSRQYSVVVLREDMDCSSVELRCSSIVVANSDENPGTGRNCVGGYKDL